MPPSSTPTSSEPVRRYTSVRNAYIAAYASLIVSESIPFPECPAASAPQLDATPRGWRVSHRAGDGPASSEPPPSA
jgi:hypothetical protein